MESWKTQTKQKLLDFLQELQNVCSNCGRKAEDITVLFATKYINPERFVSFVDICREINIVPVVIGENRVQEAEEKMEYLQNYFAEVGMSFLRTSQTRPDAPVGTQTGGRAQKDNTSPQNSRFSVTSSSFNSICFVLIGTLQTNKINKAIGIFDEIHSIDSLELAKALDTRLEREGRTMPVFLEVNVSGEESKHGFGVEEIKTVIKSFRLLKSLKLEGLMTMAPYSDDPEKARPFFRKLRQLADKYGLQTSMGMSHDWMVAIEEGTDMIRIGSKMFQHTDMHSHS